MNCHSERSEESALAQQIPHLRFGMTIVRLIPHSDPGRSPTSSLPLLSPPGLNHPLKSCLPLRRQFKIYAMLLDAIGQLS